MSLLSLILVFKSFNIMFFPNSNFGGRFTAAAANCAAKSRHDGFETAMIEIKAEDWKPFMEDLGQL